MCKEQENKAKTWKKYEVLDAGRSRFRFRDLAFGNQKTKLRLGY